MMTVITKGELVDRCPQFWEVRNNGYGFFAKNSWGDDKKEFSSNRQLVKWVKEYMECNRKRALELTRKLRNHRHVKHYRGDCGDWRGFRISEKTYILGKYGRAIHVYDIKEAEKILGEFRNKNPRENARISSILSCNLSEVFNIIIDRCE